MRQDITSNLQRSLTPTRASTAATAQLSSLLSNRMDQRSYDKAQRSSLIKSELLIKGNKLDVMHGEWGPEHQRFNQANKPDEPMILQ